MKKLNRLGFISLIAAAIAYVSPLYADPLTCNGSFVHCLNETTSGSGYTGKYVKFTWVQLSISGVVCMPYNSSTNLDTDSINQNNIQPGPQTWVFEQCSDSACTSHIPLITDRFTLIKEGNAYTSKPLAVSFNLNKNYGPTVTCSPSSKLPFFKK